MDPETIQAGHEFSTADSTRQRVGESDAAWADRTFKPCFPGVHVCGADHEENRFFTVLNLPTPDDEGAAVLWRALKEECEVERDAADFCVDLNTASGHEDDFWSNRQMLPRILSKATGAT